MQSSTLEALYIVSAAGLAGIFTFGSAARHKLTTFLLSFWILGASVIREPLFNLPIKQLRGEIEPHELLFFVLLACLLGLTVFRPRKFSPMRRFPYEKYFYIFLGWFLIVIIYHLVTGALEFREFRSIGEGTVMVLILYRILRQAADEHMVKVLGRSLIVVALASTAVAVIQFFIDPDFLRIGSSRLAFGSRIRSNGVYSAEYIHAYVLVLAVSVTLIGIESKRLKWFLIPSFLVGILLSFHRMSWIVTAIVLAMYLVLERRKSLSRIALAGGTALFIYFFFTTIFTNLAGDVEATEVYRARLSANTLTDRFKIVEMILERVDRIYLWGAGSRRSDLYYHGMLSIGQTNEWAMGQKGGLHNLYLETLFFYGLPVLFLFSLLMLSIMTFFRRLHRQHGAVFLIPLQFAVMYCVMNLTNSFPWYREFGFFMGIVLGSAAFFAAQLPALDARREGAPAWR